MTRQGIKISLEGIDGVGKSTQLPVLNDFLIDRGYDVYVKPCRNNFAGNGLDGTLLGVLKGSRHELAAFPAAEVLLAAARSLIIHDTYLAGHLAAEGVVLCDRDIDSAVAYSLPGLQRRYPDKNPQWLANWVMGAYAPEPVTPDLTLWLDAPLEVALGRAMDDDAPNERAIFDEHGVALIQEVQTAYQGLHELFPDRIQRIDVSQKTAPEVSEELLERLDLFLADPSRGVA